MSFPSWYRDPYHYETERFSLRRVRGEDAPALLKCYSDPAAVALMNDDNCSGGFLFCTVEEVRNAIQAWNQDPFAFVRLAVIDKETGEPVGTLEIFGGDTGILRVDLRADCETRPVLTELYTLAVERFPADFPMAFLATKAVPQAAARRQALQELGFSGPERFRDYENYYRLPAQKFRRELGIAPCGLACCLCSENADCLGCRNDGCTSRENCSNYRCCRAKKVRGCWECRDFPCGQGMQGNTRIRAFGRFVKEHGEEALLDCLERNHKAGVVYHWPGKLNGDYDLPTEEEVIALLKNSK